MQIKIDFKDKRITEAHLKAALQKYVESEMFKALISTDTMAFELKAYGDIKMYSDMADMHVINMANIAGKILSIDIDNLSTEIELFNTPMGGCALDLLNDPTMDVYIRPRLLGTFRDKIEPIIGGGCQAKVNKVLDELRIICLDLSYRKNH